jgi:hypothetical protein
MGFLSRKAAKPEVADHSLSDPAWLGESRRIFESRIDGFYGSPETMAAGGREHYGCQDFGTAMLFYAKSIDMLHTAYGFSQMRARQPSPDDAAIVDGFSSSLGAALSLHPRAPVEECVREVTHRLRSISTECDRVGLPSGVYRSALDAIAMHAPHVPTDDVSWA